MDARQQKILEAIIDLFIKNALPVGSKHLSERYGFNLSSATIRNEMAFLEKEGYIIQPHTSAGRVPTQRAYRLLVDQLGEEEKLMDKAMQDLKQMQQQYRLKKTKEQLYEIVFLLSSITKNVTFVTLPDKHGFFYLGISHILKQPEFIADPHHATQVIEILENELSNMVNKLDLKESGAFYIGEENILPQFQSCSLLALPYSHQGFQGVMGILGPTRMDYAYNMAALKSATQLLGS